MGIVDGWTVGQVVVLAVLGAAPLRPLADAFVLGLTAGLIGAAGAGVAVAVCGALPALSSVARAIGVLLLFALAHLAAASSAAPRRRGPLAARAPWPPLA
jgi:hypothetical protein